MSGFYSGLRQPDAAGLQYNGLHYQCFAWIDRGNVQVDAAIFVEQQQGESVLLHRATVYDQGGVTAPACPRVIADGSIFIVFWIDPSDNTLRKAWLDVSTLHTTDTWTEVASPLTLDAGELYDVHTCGDLGHNGDTPGADYVVAFKESVAGKAILHRYTSHDTWTPDWTYNTNLVCANCLGVYANATQGEAVVVFEKSGTWQLWAVCVTESNGALVGSVQVFQAAPQNAANWSVAGVCYAGADLVAVVAEGRPVAPGAPPTWLDNQRWVCYQAIKPSDATQVGNEFNTKNVSLQSRPWHGPDQYTNGGAGAQDGSIHCVLGHMGVWDQPYKWTHQSFFVANLHAEQWSTADDATNLAVPVVNLNTGTADAREHQISGSPTNAKLRNHVPSAAIGPQYGPHLKTRMIPEIVWRRLSTEAGTDDDGGFNTTVPVPIEPAVRGYVFHFEAPWVPPHQVHGPADQAASFDGLYTRGHIQSQPAGNGLFICGGTPSIYDGAQVVEDGFSWPPDVDVNELSDTSNVDVGKHYWTAVYEWRDNRGQLHRSMPARPRLIDVAEDEQVDVYARCQNLTLKHGVHYPHAHEISIAFYRTKVDGAIFYRIKPVHLTDVNDVDGWGITFRDNKSDTQIGWEEILPWQYVNGQWSPMVNFCPPALTTCTSWQNRLWGVSAEDEREVWYSMEMLSEPGGVTYEAPRWNPINRYRFDDCQGVTGLHQMDGAMVVFARDRIFILRGLGNTDVGSGTTLEHQIVAEGTGCINPQSIVLGPPGVFFQSDKGYYLLTRTLELEYLSAGAAIEDQLRDAGNVRAAVLLEDRHEIRLLCDGSIFGTPEGLVYNYLFGVWYRHALPAGHSVAKWGGNQDALYWRGQDGQEAHVFLQTSTLAVERPGGDGSEFKDTDNTGNIPIAVVLETDWIHLSGLAGFNRLRKVLVQLEKPNASEMQIVLYLDYTGKYLADGDSKKTFTYTSPSEEILAAAASAQKCNAFRVKVLESGTVPQTENVSIQGMRLEYMKKRGPVRLPDAHKVVPT